MRLITLPVRLLTSLLCNGAVTGLCFILKKLLARLEINGLDEEIGLNEQVLQVVHDAGQKGISSRDIARKFRGFRNLDAVQKNLRY